MVGQTLRDIREGKGMSLEYVCGDELSKAQLSRIETKGQMPRLDNFSHILSRLNVTFEEFFELDTTGDVGFRTQLGIQIEESVKKNDLKKITFLLPKIKAWRTTNENIFLAHMEVILTAAKMLLQTNHDVEQVRQSINQKDLLEMKEYLDSMDQWYHYELAILNNILFLFEPEVVTQWAERAIRVIKKREAYFKDNDISRRLLTNLSKYYLTHRKYLDAYTFSSDAIALGPSTNHLCSIILAKVLNQIASFKLANGQYDEAQVRDLMNCFLVVDMLDHYQSLKSLVSQYGIAVVE